MNVSSCLIDGPISSVTAALPNHLPFLILFCTAYMPTPANATPPKAMLAIAPADKLVAVAIAAPALLNVLAVAVVDDNPIAATVPAPKTPAVIPLALPSLPTKP